MEGPDMVMGDGWRMVGSGTVLGMNVASIASHSWNGKYFVGGG